MATVTTTPPPHTQQRAAAKARARALEPRVCLPGHGGPLTGDARAQLERAADAG